MRRVNSVVALALAFLVCFAYHSPLSANVLDRDCDPVILDGGQLNDLIGLSPDKVVAFRYSSGWVQIPLQIDERALNDFGTVYDTIPLGVTTVGYADAGTFAGADPDPTFDSNDELVFMAKDAGDRVPSGTPNPAGVILGSRVEVIVGNPLNGQACYVYLFETDGTLNPGAGTSYVTYTFNLLSGPYLTTYNTLVGPNPENSQVTTPHYATHFSDRWIRDELNVFTGVASGVDILDRHKNAFAPGNCVRTEDTFSAGEGAFFVNKSGPVRGIRSYIGANSGPFTQREHFFYERRHDVVTYLRVHPIGSIVDFYDYGPAGGSLIYYNDLNLGGVTIDGNPVPDVVAPGQIVWEMVTGIQGTATYAHTITTDIVGLTYTSYYEDDLTPITTQCTGDVYALGSSGPFINVPIPNTDPGLGPFNIFVTTRSAYFDPPYQTTTLALQRYSQGTTPLIAGKVPTAVGELPHAGVRLAQSFPNPFRDRTSIGFSAPRGTTVTLRVYDVSGRFVRTLHDGEVTGDETLVSWDGLDHNGRRAASGVYFYRLDTGIFVQTRKLVLLD